MEKRAKEFLDITARYYERNKVKWDVLLKSLGLKFDDDIYNDTILAVYDKIEKGDDFEGKTDDEIMAYWYRSFINNIKRDRLYSKNRRTDDDVMELLKDSEYIVDNHSLYFVKIRLILNKVRDKYDELTYHLFKMYYMIPDMTYEELSSIVGFDVKPKISRVRKWLQDVIQQDY